jgi:hypothetical protein
MGLACGVGKAVMHLRQSDSDDGGRLAAWYDSAHDHEGSADRPVNVNQLLASGAFKRVVTASGHRFCSEVAARRRLKSDSQALTSLLASIEGGKVLDINTSV